MSRLLAFVAVLVCFVPLVASAQDACPPGELCALRSDDPRCSEGFRCFEFGPFVSGSRVSLRRMLEIVNNDIEDSSRYVTMEQIDAANACSVIYHSPGVRNLHNGVCPAFNGTSERISFETFSEEHPDSVRWPMAGQIYRVPAVARLTPGEEAEHLAHEIDEAAVTGTVRAPDWIGPRITRIRELTNSGELTSSQVDGMLAALERSLGRVPAESPAASPVPAPSAPDMEFSLHEIEPEAHAPAPAPASVPASAVMALYEDPYFWGILISASLVFLLVGFAFGRRDKNVAVTQAGTASQDKIIELSEANSKLQKEITRLSGGVPAATTAQMNEVEALKGTIKELEGRLTQKRADDAAETAEISNNKSLVATLRKHWDEFYRTQERVVRRLNEANVINLFKDLELFVIFEKLWAEHHSGSGKSVKEVPRLDRDSIKALFDDAALMRQLRWNWKPELGDLNKEAMLRVTSAAYNWQGASRRISDLEDSLVSARAESVKSADELEQKSRELTETENKCNDLEQRAMQLGSIITSLGLDVDEVISGWAGEAEVLTGHLQAVISSAVLAAAPFIGDLLGENAMVPAGAAPLGGSLTRVEPIPRSDTSPFGKPGKKANGNGSSSHDRWTSSVPPARGPHKSTLPPSAGLFHEVGRYGPKPAMHADGIPPESLKATVEDKALNPDGTEVVTDPPKPKQPSAAPATVDLIGGEDDTPTRPADNR